MDYPLHEMFIISRNGSIKTVETVFEKINEVPFKFHSKTGAIME
jgi:hypothetical protein